MGPIYLKKKGVSIKPHITFKLCLQLDVLAFQSQKRGSRSAVYGHSLNILSLLPFPLA